MRFSPAATALVLGLTLLPSLAHAESQRSTPGLVLAVDGRYATCDMMAFLPDGTRLFACGDDKVVRRYEVGQDGFSARKLTPLRWPILREQRGSIYAMAFSPDADADSIAIGGIGLRTGAVFVLDRYKGEVEHTLSPVPSSKATWAITYSPSGKHLVYGTDSGEIYTWNLGAKEKTSRLLPETGGKSVNRVRCISFLSNAKDETRFAFVAQDGKIRVGDVSKPTTAPRALSVSLELSKPYQVVASPDRRWLAATGEGEPGAKNRNFERVEMLDLRAAVAGQETRKFLAIPRQDEDLRVPHCLAFDSTGSRLAVGCRVHPLKGTFYREKGGLIFFFDLKTDKRLTVVLDVGYRPDAIAFRPTPKGSPTSWQNQVATAGGNNHEVRLWDISGKGSVLDVIESPGACLWGVALAKPDKDNRIPYLAWKERRANPPTHPNKWGAGEWRVFDLKKKGILPRPPKDFDPVLPIEKGGPDGDWRVETTSDAYVWRVVGPGRTDVKLDASQGLYDPNFNNLPRCYTFIPYPDNKDGKAPVYLAVGHTWGVSLYECMPGSVKLARVLIGHEGEVMSVAPSADGSQLVTASRDQTLAGWSLAPWPAQRELGASFRNENGKLVVKEVSPGSPAWDGLNPQTGGEDDRCRLSEGDEIDFIVFTRDRRQAFYYDPNNRRKDYTTKYGVVVGTAEKVGTAKAIELLANTVPNAEMFFIKKVDGKDVFKLTTVKQRPLWRMFPERHPDQLTVTRRGRPDLPLGKDFVIWRWRDYYYDTNSARADKYVGWQVNPLGGQKRPDFFPLERMQGSDDVLLRGERAGFHKPEKVWVLFTDGLAKPDNVIFPDIQPPDVTLAVVTKPGKNTDLVLSVSIKPRDGTGKQKLSQKVNLWLNDYRVPVALKPDKDGNIEVKNLPIKRSELRKGRNSISLLAYNVEGGRGQATAFVEFDDGAATVRTLRALCVGINDYRKVKGYGFEDLNCSKNDAEEMKRVFEQHGKSKLYQRAIVHHIPEKDATAKEILTRLKELGENAKPDDWLVVFLSGHGHAERTTADDYKAGSFFFLCADTDRKVPATHLSSKRLYDALSDIKCSKMLILDCCHSGDVASNPLRDLARDGVPYLILSSCKGDQSALEPKKGKHGFFTQALLEAVSDSTQAKGKIRAQPVMAEEIGRTIVRRLKELLTKYNVDPEEQEPEFLPLGLTRDAVLCRP